MPNHFVFVDETGNLGRLGEAYYGYGILEVPAAIYSRIRQILAEERFRFRFYKDFEIPLTDRPAEIVFTQLAELAEHDLVAASGLYIDKAHYGGRYLTWTDVSHMRDSDWPHYARNYLLRKALEFHFSNRETPEDKTIDLVLDRIAVNADQRRNLEDYLRSKKTQERPFALPGIEYVTISDSAYTEGLQLAHMIASIVKKVAKGTLTEKETELSRFVHLAGFVGHQDPGSPASETRAGTASPKG